MKSKFALTLVIAAGFMLSTTGASLALSGESGSGNAAQSQYQTVGPNNESGAQGVKGVNLESDKNGADAQKPAATEAQNTEPVVEEIPTEAAQVAVTGESGSLPFTGFVAIPVLIVGLALLVGGALLRTRLGPRRTE